MTHNKKRGFTLIEILITLCILAMLAGVVIIAVNPARQFAKARDAQRWSDVNAILNAVHQVMTDNHGNWPSATCEALPTSAETIKMNDSDPATDEADICACLVPTYVAKMPFDPSAAGASYTSCTGGYDTKYTIVQSAAGGRVTVAATGEIEIAISVTR